MEGRGGEERGEMMWKGEEGGRREGGSGGGGARSERGVEAPPPSTHSKFQLEYDSGKPRTRTLTFETAAPP